jgi:serine/threonine protein kinase
MPAIKITCPACKKSLTLADDTQPTFTCPGCKKTLKRSSSSRSTTASQRTAGGNERAADSATPATFGRFQIKRKLGSGAFGTVYLAHDPQLDRAVALKVPNPGTLSSPRKVERFLREARAAANLRHPNIVPLYEAGQQEGNYFIASAFIHGQPLADAIPEGGMFLAEAAQIVRQLAEALAYAHEQGIVHRDIKPANVMLDDKGTPHLMDFGLAARTDEAEKLTHDGAILGTPSYMAPEQAEGQKGEAQPASDQYSLGILLYELLTDHTPFSGPVQAVLAQVLSQDPDSPRKSRPEIPRDLETI